ncbi:outer membrane beta-barrel protein [Rhodocytophaga aerolata]|uniref:Outer membrane beta-barrel protein n=1 Tax=Rhodocytophaga aerolata TaxID=455078 RepID=A0ABT8RI10_9BACT|nr:outer membrane beta-barrel protein [Rhodocytophaga aerolata]MDO1451361.1 outer membrane beta-barrel protein [Rhodocytophaga aerolata]
MKTYVLIFLLVAMPLLIMAQSSTFSRQEASVAGRWQVGVTVETIPFEPASSKIGIAGLAGYHISPHFSLQTGFTLTNLQQRSTLMFPATITWGNYTGSVNAFDYMPGFYMPVSLQYTFLKPFRRLQPYLVLRSHFYFAHIRQAIGTYENSSLVDQQIAPTQSTSGFGITSGVGIQYRIINRFTVFGEVSLGRTFQKNSNHSSVHLQDNTSFVAPGRMGIVYTFRQKR